MREFEFTLKFSLADGSLSPESYLERLDEEGCNDALVGIGRRGRIALQFNREADNALEAVSSAIQGVRRAIPHAKFIEATPDLVGLSDIADVLGFSRQNIRKIMLKNHDSFPAPIHEGKSEIWRLSAVLAWLDRTGHYSIDESLMAVARANMNLNIANETSHLDPSMKNRLFTVLA